MMLRHEWHEAVYDHRNTAFSTSTNVPRPA